MSRLIASARDFLKVISLAPAINPLNKVLAISGWVKSWNCNTKNTITFSGSKIIFLYSVVLIDFSNDQNTMRKLHFHIKDLNTHQR